MPTPPWSAPTNSRAMLLSGSSSSLMISTSLMACSLMTSPTVHERRLPWSRDRRRGAGPREDVRQRPRRPPRARRRRHRGRARASSWPSSGARARASRRSCTSSAALDRPEAGTIEVAGRARWTARPSASSRACAGDQVGFVFQAYHLVPELTGEENVLLPTRLPGSAPGAPARGRALIERLGLDGVAGAPAPRALAAASSSASRWRARSSTIRRSCWPTSRPATSTPRPGAAVLALLRGAADDGRAVVLVTHERGGHERRRPRPAPASTGAWGREARPAGLRGACCSAAAMARRGGDRRLRAGHRASTAPRAQADLPDVIVRFRAESRAEIDRISRALPNVAARSYRLEFTGVGLRAGTARRRRAACALVDRGRRGYAIVDGRDVDRARRTRSWSSAAWPTRWHVERRRRRSTSGAWARCAWSGIARGARQRRLPARLGAARCTSRARGSSATARRRFAVDQALIWAARPRPRRRARCSRRAPQHSGARRALRHAQRRRACSSTGGGHRHRAAGRVLAHRARRGRRHAGAAARADVRRRLPAIGVQRAIGFSRGADRRRARLARTRWVALPAAAAGLAVGALAVAAGRRPAGDPQRAAAGLGGAAAARRRAGWRSSRWSPRSRRGRPGARRAPPPAALLRGGERRARAAARLRLGGGFVGRSAARLVAGPPRARSRRRVAVLAVGARRRAAHARARLAARSACATTPATLGKRYDLTVRRPTDPRCRRRARMPGVAAAAPR